jgi:cell division protease FtsH
LDGDNVRRAVSAEVSTEIDRLLKETIDRAHLMATNILEQNRELLESTACVLLDREVLEGDDLRQILSQAKAPAGLSDWLHSGNVGS